MTIPFDEPQQRLLSRNGLLLPLLRSLILSDAVKGISISAEDARRCLSAWCQRHGIKSDEALVAFLQSQSLSLAEARWQAELSLRVNRHCLEHYSHRAEQRFLQRKTDLDRVVYSLIRTKDGGLAQELYLRIAEGESSFADLATEHGMGHERASRGIIGPCPLTQAHPRLVELLRTGQNGQLFSPLCIESWWLVVRLEQLQPAVFDESMQAAMAKELFDEWIASELQSQINALPVPQD